MPHCGDCLRFYPSVMPSGCPFCDTHKYHTKPYCQFCRSLMDAAEVGPDGQPLRPMCPVCAQGPMLPSSKELMRRMTLDIKILPFVPSKEEVAQALMESTEPVKIDATTLGQVSIRRTRGPVELFVQSGLIEDYFRALAATFHGEKDSIESFDPKAGTVFKSGRPAPSAEASPWSGLRYYKVSCAGGAFYNVSGTYTYQLRGFGFGTVPPGMPGDHYYDLSLLMAVGLKDGVTFRFPVVTSDPGLLAILNAVKEGMVAFYANYMRPVTHNVIIAIRQESPKKVEPKISPSEWTPSAPPLGARPAQPRPRR